MIQQGREQGVNEAYRRSQPLSAFRCDPLAPLGFEITALDHVGLEKVGRVEQIRSSAELFNVSWVTAREDGTYVDESAPHGFCKLIRSLVAAPQAGQNDQEVDVDQARAP